MKVERTVVDRETLLEWIYDELDLHREEPHDLDFGEESTYDPFHEKYYNTEKLDNLLVIVNEDGTVSRNEENIEAFSDDYEDFIETHPEILFPDVEF